MAHKSLGQLIKEGRELTGGSQLHYAKQMGVTQQALARWETDEGLPRSGHFLKLSRLLGIPEDEANQARLVTMRMIERPKLGEGSANRSSAEKFPSKGTGLSSGFTLMRELSTALEKGELDGDQIEELRAMVKGFTPLF